MRLCRDRPTIPDRFVFLFFTVTAQPGCEGSPGSGGPQLLPLWVMNNAVTLKAFLHGKCLPTARICASERTQFLMEGLDVALQVEGSSERPVTIILGTHQDNPLLRVDSLVLMQEPGVLECLVALVTAHSGLVLLLPVLQEVCPGFRGEAAAFLLTRVTTVHLLVSLQLAGEGEAHLATLVSAPITRQLCVLLALVRLQLFVFPELQATAFKLTHVHFWSLHVDAAYVPAPVGVGGEGLGAAVLAAHKRLMSAVSESMSRQMRLVAE